MAEHMLMEIDIQFGIYSYQTNSRNLVCSIAWPLGDHAVSAMMSLSASEYNIKKLCDM